MLEILCSNLKVGCRVDRTWLVVLIQGRSERGGIGSGGSAGFVLIEVGVVEIIVVKVLLLAPDAPGSVSQSGKK